jgi:hypothetical protein
MLPMLSHAFCCSGCPLYSAIKQQAHIEHGCCFECEGRDVVRNFFLNMAAARGASLAALGT